ncbi:MAG: phosphoribosylanthranilate isomerase [Nevskiaceae bacterium]|nr:MAG: phosphoribosylanthranilate isomerase [Nevskiaceae bacterium]
MRTRIKFCGITRLEDAQAAVALGVEALGFVLVPQSARFIRAVEAAAIRRALPPFVSVVALLRDADDGFVREAIATLRPDLLQFHGDESPEQCERYAMPYMKAVAMAQPQDLAAWSRRYAQASALLLDGHDPAGMGGSGKTFDWSRAGGAAKPLVLAGGLHAGNVADGIRQLRPYAVDVSSGIEARPGIKDATKMRAFVAAVRAVDAQIASQGSAS